MRGHALSMVSRASDVIVFENLLYEYDTCSVTDKTIFVFSRDIKAAMSVSLNSGTAAVLVSSN